ncbi:MAG: aldo/keto reductase [Candidatus Devosia euplotis]|nr:aldo/keto reductase [Candidatus Devosia euplotis]
MRSIIDALEIGYRHIDTAQTYDTEAECGKAIARSGLRRGEVFVTTKISTENFGPGALVPSLQRSLEALGMEHVDLTLIHWPSPHDKVALPIYLEQIGEAQALGLTKMIGVSNFPIALLERAKVVLGGTKLLNNQFECRPYLQNTKLVNYCLENDISVTCYLPIARGALQGNASLEALATRRNCTVEQLALAYALARGLAAIPASGNRDRLASNFAAASIALDSSEMAVIAAQERGTRYIDFDWGPPGTEPGVH